MNAKKADKTDPSLIPAGFFALRSPLLPFHEFVAWSEGLAAPATILDPIALESALAKDRAVLRARLRSAIERPDVREALFVASPRLETGIDDWISNPDSENGQKVERPLVRYFSRMSSRPTPFGLFAGCSVGTIAPETHLVIEPRTQYQRHTRLDMYYLTGLTDALVQDPALKGALRYRPNSSLYAAAGRLHYAQARSHGQSRVHHLVAIEPSDYLIATLDRAAATKEGALLTALAETLVVDDPELTQEDTTVFIDELVAAQILVPELAPGVTGPEPIHGLIAQLREHGAKPDVVACLEQTRDALTTLDTGGLGSQPAVYRDIAKSLETLPIPVELTRLFQVDMVKPAPKSTLGEGIVAEMMAAIETLRKISPSRSEGALDKFRQSFTQRFDDQEVPLMLALDDESGIGYGAGSDVSPLLERVPLGRASEETVPYAARHAFLLSMLQQALARGAREINLTRKDLERLENPSPTELPGSLAMMAILGARSDEAFAAGDFRLYVHAIDGPSGAKFLGRFCHADPELHERVIRHLRDEESLIPDAIFAEIVHLPEGRIGNVICRPVLRAHEIPFLGQGGATLENQIPINDLMVSVVRGEVVLRSKARGKRVIPRMTNAHNFSARSIGLYKFLCDVGRQGTSPIGFDWGPLAHVPYRPRIVMDRLVLSVETWRLDAEKLKTLGDAKGATRFAAVQRLRDEIRLPRYIALVDHDNVLPVDLDNALSVESFVHLVKGRSEATLTEIAPGSDELCVHGPEGRFTHELLVPFLHRATARNESAPNVGFTRGDIAATKTIQRTFLPGSQWLFAKLYTGTATADRVLRALHPVINQVLASGAADSWYFIRYSDPDWHLRLRFHGSPSRLIAEVLPSLHEAMASFLADGLVWKFVCDTYVREIERYGGSVGIELAERLFEADSQSALGIVELLEGDAGAEARWRLALRGIDQLLDDLGLAFDQKRHVIRLARVRFRDMLRVGVTTDRAIGDKFRKERVSIEPLLDRTRDAQSEFAPALSLLSARSKSMQAIATDLRAAEAAGKLTVPIVDLAGSYIHMVANRLLRSAAREQEAVIYDLLDRCYESRAARTRETKRKNNMTP